MRDQRERLRNILDAIARIERYALRGRDAFNHDDMLLVAQSVEQADDDDESVFG